jgi:mannose-6-phosphate isomerase-like protein (cupin superfamily)
VSGSVVAEQDVSPRREDGDTAETRVTLSTERLEQRVIRFAAGRSHPRTTGQYQELLYVVSGSGTLWLGDEAHALDPGTSAYLLPGEEFEIENPGAEPLAVLSVLAPGQGEPARRAVTVRFADREELRADEKRTFRVLASADTGCPDVTQFVGIVEPCRAPDHSHPYDEVGYILEGRGIAHVAGRETPIGPGSCFHLPPGSVHCIENTGPAVMRILGVFHPSGSPKQRSYEAAG